MNSKGAFAPYVPLQRDYPPVWNFRLPIADFRLPNGDWGRWGYSINIG